MSGINVIHADAYVENPNIAVTNEAKDTIGLQEPKEPEQAEKEANNILNNSETKKQIAQLQEIQTLYDNWNLLWISAIKYENLKKDIQKELDKAVLPYLESKTNSIDYYKQNPEAAENEANDIIANPNNWEQVNTLSWVLNSLKKGTFPKEKEKPLKEALDKFKAKIEEIYQQISLNN